MTTRMSELLITEGQAEFRLAHLRGKGQKVTMQNIASWWMPADQSVVVYDKGVEALFKSTGHVITPAAVAVFEAAL